MKTPFTYLVTGLAAVAIGGAVALAPITSAASQPEIVASATAPAAIGSPGTDPLVPYGTEPQEPAWLGYVDSSHHEANTTNGQVDLPF